MLWSAACLLRLGLFRIRGAPLRSERGSFVDSVEYKGIHVLSDDCLKCMIGLFEKKWGQGSHDHFMYGMNERCDRFHVGVFST